MFCNRDSRVAITTSLASTHFLIITNTYVRGQNLVARAQCLLRAPHAHAYYYTVLGGRSEAPFCEAMRILLAVRESCRYVRTSIFVFFVRSPLVYKFRILHRPRSVLPPVLRAIRPRPLPYTLLGGNNNDVRVFSCGMKYLARCPGYTMG